MNRSTKRRMTAADVLDEFYRATNEDPRPKTTCRLKRWFCRYRQQLGDRYDGPTLRYVVYLFRTGRELRRHQ